MVLLPDEDGTPSGRATVSDGSSTVELTDANAATQAIAGRAPTAPTVLPDDDVQRTFGEAIAGLPADALHITLYFLLDSDQLTPDSRNSLPAILPAVEARPVPEVTIIGHTDSTGSAASNYTLGYKRAAAVRGILVATGVDPALIDIASHGESELLVPTPDNTNEPRNRRVEIVIK